MNDYDKSAFLVMWTYSIVLAFFSLFWPPKWTTFLFIPIIYSIIRLLMIINQIKRGTYNE